MKNQALTTLLRMTFFLLLFCSSLRLNAQVGDPLVIDSTKVQVNTNLEVRGTVKANSFNNDGSTATFGGDLLA